MELYFHASPEWDVYILVRLYTRDYNLTSLYSLLAVVWVISVSIVHETRRAARIQAVCWLTSPLLPYFLRNPFLTYFLFLATKDILHITSPEQRAECKHKVSLLILKRTVLKYNACLSETQKTLVKILLFWKRNGLKKQSYFELFRILVW
jgi:hypothetical protein